MEQDMVDLNEFFEYADNLCYRKNIAIKLCKERKCPYCKIDKKNVYCDLFSVNCPLVDYQDRFCHSALIKKEWEFHTLQYLAAKIVICGSVGPGSSMSAEMFNAYKLIADHLDFALLPNFFESIKDKRLEYHLC